jgi:hypothetical protein
MRVFCGEFIMSLEKSSFVKYGCGAMRRVAMMGRTDHAQRIYTLNLNDFHQLANGRAQQLIWAL